MAKAKAKTKTKPKAKARTATKAAARPKARPKTKAAAKRVTAKTTIVAARPTKADIGKRRAQAVPAAEVRLRVTAPVRQTPAPRPMSLMRELPLFKGKN